MKRFLSLTLPAAVIAVLVYVVPAVAGYRLGDLQHLVQRLNGSPQYQQSISATTTSDTQATAFNGGETLFIQASDDVYCRGVTSDSGTATTTNGVLVRSTADFYLTLKGSETHVACITGTGTSTVRLFKME